MQWEGPYYEDERGKSVRNHPAMYGKKSITNTILDYGFKKTNTIYITKKVFTNTTVSTNYKIFFEFSAPLIRNSELVLKLIIIIGGIFSLIKYV